ncbi:hypothetical protein [Pedobacter hartonius]|uniref:Lipoprotein n=1 Tax=Pedobacter hartonius TaxID=425514 RepID=A0A1H4GTB6_9SPHI|nr:hypothetical protein [Pedobacter hartonius]SEB12571.1 hypothetical protein SAMN05443550_11177 [Pedobacter hartonius]
MRKQTTLVLSLLALVLLSFSCSKRNDAESFPVLDEKNLTPCPANANCEFLFTEQADVEPVPGIFKTGAYRLFWSRVVRQSMSSVLYIKAPMKGNSFTLNQSDITNGKIEISRSCPACLFVASKLVDGYVKGINLSPGKPADQTSWIVEAQLISESMYGTPLRDTVSVKQYFYPNFVYN